MNEPPHNKNAEEILAAVTSREALHRAYGQAWVCTKNHDDASDLAHDAILTGIEKIKAGNLPSTEDPVDWMCGIVRIRALERRRKEALNRKHLDAYKLLIESTQHQGVISPSGWQEIEEYVSNALAKCCISSRDARIFISYILRGQTAIQLATEWDITPSYVNKIVSQVRQALKEYYTNDS